MRVLGHFAPGQIVVQHDPILKNNRCLTLIERKNDILRSVHIEPLESGVGGHLGDLETERLRVSPAVLRSRGQYGQHSGIAPQYPSNPGVTGQVEIGERLYAFRGRNIFSRQGVEEQVAPSLVEKNVCSCRRDPIMIEVGVKTEWDLSNQATYIEVSSIERTGKQLSAVQFVHEGL